MSSLTKRLSRIKTYAAAAADSLALPNLVLTALARDSPFGPEGDFLRRMLGKCFRVLPLRTRIAHGHPAWVNLHDLGSLVSFEEILISNSYDLEQVPFLPDLILDCGAHIGLFSLLAALKYPDASLLAFEPVPANAALARRQIERFGSRASLEQAAVSTTNGSAPFDTQHGSNSGHLASAQGEQLARVRTIDLRSVIEELAPRMLLMKMDIEGAEVEVLPHVLPILPADCVLFFETHGADSAWLWATALLQSCGFMVSCSRNRDGFHDGVALRRGQTGSIP